MKTLILALFWMLSVTTVNAQQFTTFIGGGGLPLSPGVHGSPLLKLDPNITMGTVFFVPAPTMPAQSTFTVILKLFDGASEHRLASRGWKEGETIESFSFVVPQSGNIGRVFEIEARFVSWTTVPWTAAWVEFQ